MKKREKETRQSNREIVFKKDLIWSSGSAKKYIEFGGSIFFFF